TLLKSEPDEQSECLIYNISAQYHKAIGNIPKSFYYLDKSANLAPKLPQELKLFTIANVGITTLGSSPEKAREYIKAARKLSKSLNFDRLADEFSEMD